MKTSTKRKKRNTKDEDHDYLLKACLAIGRERSKREVVVTRKQTAYEKRVEWEALREIKPRARRKMTANWFEDEVDQVEKESYGADWEARGKLAPAQSRPVERIDPVDATLFSSQLTEGVMEGVTDKETRKRWKNRHQDDGGGTGPVNPFTI